MFENTPFCDVFKRCWKTNILKWESTDRFYSLWKQIISTIWENKWFIYIKWIGRRDKFISTEIFKLSCLDEICSRRLFNIGKFYCKVFSRIIHVFYYSLRVLHIQIIYIPCFLHMRIIVLFVFRGVLCGPIFVQGAGFCGFMQQVFSWLLKDWVEFSVRFMCMKYRKEHKAMCKLDKNTLNFDHKYRQSQFM